MLTSAQVRFLRGHAHDLKAILQVGGKGITDALVAEVDNALEQHELPAREDPDRLAFELHAILLAADTKFVLLDDPAVLDFARQIVHQRLGLSNGSTAS